MDIGQVRGGTNAVGVPASAFAMPDGLRMRYDMPHPSLAEYITGYAIYASSDPEPMVNWYLPAPAMISILVDAGPLTVSLGSHSFGPLERATLYGPTSRAFRTVTHHGIAVGIGLSALGWARLTARSAGDFHNRLVPLSSLLGAEIPGSLIRGLDALDSDAMIKPLLDTMLAPLFHRSDPSDRRRPSYIASPREGLIRAFAALAVTDGIIEMKDAADRLSVPTHELRRMTIRYFGMPPKLLLRRARFLRSFIGLLREGSLGDYSSIDSSYFDASHFLRDAGTFLGTTPRRFLASETVFLKASLRARAAVMGASTQALHDATAKDVTSMMWPRSETSPT